MVGTFVKELEIYSDSDNMPLSELDEVLSRLPCLRSLRIRHVVIPLCSKNESLLGWKTPKSLEILDLQEVYFQSPGWSAKHPEEQVPSSASAMPVQCSFVELINLFAMVNEFTLMNTGFDWGRSTGTTYGRYWDNRRLAKIAASHILPSFRVEKIVTSVGDGGPSNIYSNGDILRVFGESANMTGLRRLDTWDLEPVNHDFLWDVGHALTYLHLRFDPICESLQRKDEYGIGYCTSLENLKISVTMDLGIEETSKESRLYSYAHLLNIVTNSPMSMETLVVNLEYDSIDRDKHLGTTYFRGLKWNAMDSVLASHEALEKVTFVFLGGETRMSPNFEEEMSLVKTMLPRLTKKKILHCVGFLCYQLFLQAG
ncbi:hypothetical protein EIP91_000924 [Steccherinum ochraceum]|uniref:FBD domain-containing protein n=1 Tax=Steccherinum ochraceum TaxID=92696 RepID=A0A4R0RSL3_9APHY|nr:hypothetical protein EIP91_000924 [Steccherinum ochraceum]